MLESGYLTYLSGQTNVIYKQNGNYIDLNNPSTFYFDQDGSQKLTPEDMLRCGFQLLIPSALKTTPPYHWAM